MGLLDGTTQQQYYESGEFGNYQFTSLDNIITQFMIAYVGEGKIIPKTTRTDVTFHAKRALQELSFDTFKSCKSQELEVPSSLLLPLPQDYVNYIKLTYRDDGGIEHILYPASKTSNPFTPQVDSNNNLLFDGDGFLIPSGNLVDNGDLLAGKGAWILNESGSDGYSPQPITTTTGISGSLFSSQVGWFWEKNYIIGYNLPQNYSVRQINVPIRSGEDYKITYTISGYSSGSYNFVIVDENGHYTATTARSADGTYEETITAGGTVPATLYNQTKETVYFQNTSSTDGNVKIDSISIVRIGSEQSSTTWSKYKSRTPSENSKNDDYEDDTYWPYIGQRYGISPEHAQANGSFYIDCNTGLVHFSSNLSGKEVIIKYISDSLGTDEEMKVHKFAEEAMYKWIAYAIISTRVNSPEFLVARFKRERFAETRKAKLRLSNIKIEEITQILRGKSKNIKH